MEVDLLLQGLKGLQEDSRKELDSSTARQKLLEAFELADMLKLHIDDPLQYSLTNSMIGINREYLDKYEKFNFDLQGFCGHMLFTWDSYTKRQEWEKSQREHHKYLSELRKQGKI